MAWLNDQQNNQQVGGQKHFIGENAPRGAGGFGGGRGGGGAVEPGTYVVTLEVGGKKFTKPVQVLQEGWLSER